MAASCTFRTDHAFLWAQAVFFYWVHLKTWVLRTLQKKESVCMRTKKMRLVSALLALAMLFVMMPVGAFADDETTETVTTITPAAVANAEDGYYSIQTSGVYNLEGGTYTGGYIFISPLAGNVTINLLGNITVQKTVTDSNGKPSAFIVVGNCSLTINGNGHTVEAGTDLNLIVSEDGGTITLNGGTYKAPVHKYPVLGQNNSGTLSLHGTTVAVTGTENAGRCIRNEGATLNIYEGTIIDNGPAGDHDAVTWGTVSMNGGTICSKNSAAIRADRKTDNFQLNGGIIENSKYGVKVLKKNPDDNPDVTIGPNVTIGNVTFRNNTTDIYLGEGQQFTASTSFTGVASVDIEDTISGDEHRQITNNGTVKSMLAHFTSANPDYAVGYEDGHLYLYAHTHRWEYTVTGNEVTASCTTPSPNGCGQTEKVTLTAANDTETGAQDYVYSGARVTDTGMDSTGATVGKIIYEDAAGHCLAGAPQKAGTYTATVTVTAADGQSYTAKKAFTIKPFETDPAPVTPETKKYPLVMNDGMAYLSDGTVALPSESELEAGTTVVVEAPETNASGMVFKNWVVVEPDGIEETLRATGFDPTKAETSFQMPALEDGQKLVLDTLYVTPDQESSDDDFVSTAAAVAGGAALTGLVAWNSYNIFAEVYMKGIWPVLPENRIELALALWHEADEPAAVNTTPYTDLKEDDADAQRACRWAVENELIKPADKDDPDVFSPYRSVTPGQVYRAWKHLQKLG